MNANHIGKIFYDMQTYYGRVEAYGQAYIRKILKLSTDVHIEFDRVEHEKDAANIYYKGVSYKLSHSTLDMEDEEFFTWLDGLKED